MRLLLVLVCAVMMGSLGACGVFEDDDDNDNGAGGQSRAQQFLSQAARGNMVEIEAAQLALNTSQSSQVRQAAQQVLDDHRRAQQDAQRLASNLNHSLPNRPSEAQRQTLARLQGLQGANFDREFLATMESSHREQLNLFRTEGLAVNNQQVRNFAQNQIPILERHLQMAQQIRSQGSMNSINNTQWNNSGTRSNTGTNTGSMGTTNTGSGTTDMSGTGSGTGSTTGTGSSGSGR
jgi:putative membrane protein